MFVLSKRDACTPVGLTHLTTANSAYIEKTAVPVLGNRRLGAKIVRGGSWIEIDRTCHVPSKPGVQLALVSRALSALN